MIETKAEKAMRVARKHFDTAARQFCKTHSAMRMSRALPLTDSDLQVLATRGDIMRNAYLDVKVAERMLARERRSARRKG